jgi:phage gpG-like protein
MDVSSTLNRLHDIAAGVLKQAPYMLQGFIGTNMTRTSAKNAKAGLGRNTTTTLRMVSGRLFQSFNPSNAENISVINTRGDEITLSYGSKVPYAAIHEYGGTIAHPGSSKFQVFSIGNKTIYTRYTQPHSIGIPKRPYLAPAVKQMQGKGYDSLIKKLKYEILRELM